MRFLFALFVMIALGDLSLVFAGEENQSSKQIGQLNEFLIGRRQATSNVAYGGSGKVNPYIPRSPSTTSEEAEELVEPGPTPSDLNVKKLLTIGEDHYSFRSITAEEVINLNSRTYVPRIREIVYAKDSEHAISRSLFNISASSLNFEELSTLFAPERKFPVRARVELFDQAGQEALVNDIDLLPVFLFHGILPIAPSLQGSGDLIGASLEQQSIAVDTDSVKICGFEFLGLRNWFDSAQGNSELALDCSYNGELMARFSVILSSALHTPHSRIMSWRVSRPQGAADYEAEYEVVSQQVLESDSWQSQINRQLQEGEVVSKEDGNWIYFQNRLRSLDALVDNKESLQSDKMYFPWGLYAVVAVVFGSVWFGSRNVARPFFPFRWRRS